jgi:hypothetical protein
MIIVAKSSRKNLLYREIHPPIYPPMEKIIFIYFAKISLHFTAAILYTLISEDIFSIGGNAI